MASTFMLGPSTLPSTASSTETAQIVVADDTVTVKEKVSAYFKDDPIMIKIAKCESRFRQFDENGKLLTGEANPKDQGVMQINTDYHGERAKALGIDITTLEGNLDYARRLYNEQGTAPWNASKPCWQNEVAVK